MKKLITLIGPTAVGKTSLSIEIAQKFNCEIISGDSMQIYKDLDIGTAKISKEETKSIPHHLIDIRNPSDNYSVAEFKDAVQLSINHILNSNKLPLLVGGTGLYIQSVLYGYNFTQDEGSIELRDELLDFANKFGNYSLHDKLRAVDIKAAQNIHPNNVQRVIRAIERATVSNISYNESSTNRSEDMLYNCALIGLTMDREILYDRINQRVDIMVKEGLLEEARFLFENHPNSQAAKAIGYKEFFPYFTKDIDIKTAIDLVKKNSRNYAKRQMTWFRNKMPVEWFDVTEGLSSTNKEQIFNFIEGKLCIKSN
ncbi:MAG: tRNA ((37)-N6)-dimethylallyltransferase MiaA [Bacillales bacterium]|nr:tRNA ((37)-N6)-dimethylallyltransferase MiaA [Bacillales bacterium]